MSAIMDSTTSRDGQAWHDEPHGLMTVLWPATPDRKGRKRWTCECACGMIVNVYEYNLKSDKTRSCGCVRRQHHRDRLTTHGKTKTQEYTIWNQMVRRCTDPNNPRWSYYGGRGITVCVEWRHDFSAFLAHIGPRPSPKHSIDRIDNEQGYEPGNVRWATMPEQCRNRRSTRLLEFRDEKKCLRDWATITGINEGTVVQRLRYGWSVERALTVPARASNRATKGGAILAAPDVAEVRRLRKDEGLTHKAIADRFGITAGAVGHILSGRTWGHIP